MNRTEFDKTLDKLPWKRKQVLQLFLEGKEDSEIAQLLGYGKSPDGKIDSSNVRHHITTTAKDFGLSEFERDRCRPELVELFIDYKPDWVSLECCQRHNINPQKNRPDIPGRPVALDSPFYVQSAYEEDWIEEVIQPGALIRIRAPQKMGKTSLINRILASAREEGYRTVYLNLEQTDEQNLVEPAQFLHWFCSYISESPELQLQAPQKPIESMQDCTNYLQKNILAQIDTPLVLALDNVDRLFEHPNVAEPFFSLLRGWFGNATDPQMKVWEKLRQVIAHSSDVYIRLDINASPFGNVGSPIRLAPLDPEQVQKLGQIYGLKWASIKEVNQLMDMVGGHPFLIQLALYHLAKDEALTLEQLLELAPTQQGIYKNYLQELWNGVKSFPTAREALMQVLEAEGGVKLEQEQGFKLEGMGLIQFEGNRAKLSCELYRRYFQEWLQP